MRVAAEHFGRNLPINVFHNQLQFSARRCPDGCLVIQGVLPDGKYLVLKVRGQRVKVTFFGEPVETRW